MSTAHRRGQLLSQLLSVGRNVVRLELPYSYHPLLDFPPLGILRRSSRLLPRYGVVP
jgi:hypothetical protein